ncbi:MAG TPA: hypothetical protein VK849_11890 [Longimicrobiales bacterium]|nr:hypothetical protein [Longimicrobiales bacterium]
MVPNPRAASGRTGFRALVAALVAAVVGLAAPRSLHGQNILTEPESVITLAQGTSALIQ